MMPAFGIIGDVGTESDLRYVERMPKIASAGNSDTAAYAVLLSKGYIVQIKKNSDGKTGWYVAQKDGSEFIGDNPIETLGLIAMFECLGEDWKPSDAEATA